MAMGKSPKNNGVKRAKLHYYTCAGNRLVLKAICIIYILHSWNSELTVHFMTLPINTYSPLNLTTNLPYEGGCSWVF